MSANKPIYIYIITLCPEENIACNVRNVAIISYLREMKSPGEGRVSAVCVQDLNQCCVHKLLPSAEYHHLGCVHAHINKRLFD